MDKFVILAVFAERTICGARLTRISTLGGVSPEITAMVVTCPPTKSNKETTSKSDDAPVSMKEIHNSTAVLGQSTVESGWHGRRCYPDNATKTRCFADFPNAAHQPKSWLQWFMPNSLQDSYVFNKTSSLDSVDFVVEKIEQNPKYLCDYKDAFVNAIDCLGESIRTKCPFLAESKTRWYDKFSRGLTFVCSRLHEMDSICLHTHWGSMGSCKSHAYAEMSKSGEWFHSRGWHHHRHDDKKNGTWATNGTSKSHSRGWAKKSGSATNGTSKSYSRWSGRRNSTSNTNGTSWGRFRGGGRNVSDNGTEDKYSLRTKMHCRYIMLQCVRNSVATCHEKTAHIMHEFMRNTSDTECKDMMDDWEKVHVAQHVSDCTGSCNTAGRLLLHWLCLLLCGWLALMAIVRE